jgi:ATP-binding cassette subfamily C protein
MSTTFPGPADVFAGRPQSELAAALKVCRDALIGIGVFSAVSNLLMLTGSIFMLEVYDRVLPSRSVPTLLGLAMLAIILYGFQGLLDVLRSRILVRIGKSLDESLRSRVFDAVVRIPLKTRGGSGDGLQPLRDLDQVRGFLASGGPAALFDLPWIPLFLGICFLFHPLIGVTALVGSLLLVGITVLAELLTGGPMMAVAKFAMLRNALAQAARRNAEVLQAMGMTRRQAEQWTESSRKYAEAQQQASDVAGGLGALSRILRMILQSAVLGVGAYLVIQQEATAGIIIASSILMSRALAPVELAISNAKGFVAARHSWQRLNRLLLLFPQHEQPMALPPPKASLVVETVSLAPPGAQKLALQDVNLTLKAGQALGVIGPSASGKSSLMRALVGVWQPSRGKIRLDGASLDQWSSELLGRHIGYLPQDVELFDGTVAENIARFIPKADPAAVIAAAQAANVHDMVLRLPDGYETRVGEAGMALSAGQRQRIALARALYGGPFLVVLDEPNSNLDAEGEEALTKAILALRARGGIAVVVAHRASALDATDHLLVIAEGRVQAFGPKDEIMKKVQRPAAQPFQVVNA